MPSTATNGIQSSAREMLDSLRQVIERLEADLKRQQQEIDGLRAERNELRKMLADQVKHLLTDPKEWEMLKTTECTATIDDVLADIRSR